MPETDRYAPMLGYLRIRGVIAWRQNAGRILIPSTPGRHARSVYLGPEGAPDLIGWLRGGRGIAVEVKAPGGRLRDGQGAMLDQLERQGLLVLRGVKTIDELQRALDAAGVSAR